QIQLVITKHSNRSKNNFLLSILIVIIIIGFWCAPAAKYQRLGRLLYQRVESSRLPWQTCARSVNGRNIKFIEIGSGANTTMIFGAFHGSEPLSAQLAIEFAEFLFHYYKNRLECRVVIVPIVNPDGLNLGLRTNANGVDLNRNFPVQNWKREYQQRSHFPGDHPASEPETRAVLNLIHHYRPNRAISIHTPLEVINYDGPAHQLAMRMAMLNGYPVSREIGYPTPGSLGSYCGVERNIPTITLELPERNFKQLWKENRDALLLTLIYDLN
ncbi:MAG TPA: DUF2817 domain-containing protein, partial [bacterium]|nr:DUF2817 domain-containing protein [bacterium]